MSDDPTLGRGRSWFLLAFFAVAVSAYAIAVLTVPAFGPPFIAERRAVIPWAVLGHLAGGSTALLTGALQLNAGLRIRFVELHRWTGRVYLLTVAVGGASGFALALRPQGGFVTHVGFGLLAMLWLATTGMAYRRIRARDQVGHRRWMFRSYSLTFAAVTLRIYLPASLLAGLPFLPAYQAIAWACWVPNLIVTEWWFLRPRRGSEVEVGA
jgi:uncharacterized membrane protein